MNAKRVLEINPGHPVIKELLERVNDGADEDTKDLAIVLYESALLQSGYTLADANAFSKRFFKIFNGAMGISKDAPIEEPEIDLDDDEDEPKAPSHHHDDDDSIDLDDDDHHHGHGSKHHKHDADEDENVRGNHGDLWDFIYSNKFISLTLWYC